MLPFTNGHRTGLYVASLIAVTCLLNTPSISRACSCLLPPSVAESFGSADAVFFGQCVNVGLPDAASYFFLRPVTFRVLRSWKAADVEEIVIHTGMGGGDCGLFVLPGDEMLIYASRSPQDAKLYAGICSRSQSAGDNPAICFEFSELDSVAGKSPDAGCEDLVGSTKCTLCGMGCLFSLCASIGAVAALKFTRRPRFPRT